MAEKEFYSTGEVAKLLNVSPATIFRAIDKKNLKASTTPGGHYRVSRCDLEEFLKQNNVSNEVLEPRTKKVLIVEDNPAEMHLFQRALSREPLLEVMVTGSGYEAGFLTKSFKPDLIILDIFLNETDGRDITRLIRKDPALKGTKIVAVSATREPSVIEEIWDCGVDALIAKPVAPDEFLRKVMHLLK